MLPSRAPAAWLSWRFWALSWPGWPSCSPSPSSAQRARHVRGRGAFFVAFGSSVAAAWGGFDFSVRCHVVSFGGDYRGDHMDHSEALEKQGIYSANRGAKNGDRARRLRQVASDEGSRHKIRAEEGRGHRGFAIPSHSRRCRARRWCGAQHAAALAQAPEFDAAYREARKASDRQAVARLHRTSAAATTLLKTLVDPATPASVKVRAAEAIFNHAAKQSRLKTSRRVSDSWSERRGHQTGLAEMKTKQLDPEQNDEPSTAAQTTGSAIHRFDRAGPALAGLDRLLDAGIGEGPRRRLLWP